jgi:hypothetical protein
MDNGSKFPYRWLFVQRDSAGGYQPEIGCSGASVQDDEVWRKHTELRRESDKLRLGSGQHQTDEKSSKHVKQSMPVLETDTGGEVEKTKGREITLSKELGKMTP